ncbi:SixA phosphatase family protein [Streptomyces sp. NPDC088394]|uniref:SixA phosphatase family protein n=1 Tax=Streptomyces sp. NPDC088394 TaxID=3365860 RepID=UPI00382E1D75
MAVVSIEGGERRRSPRHSMSKTVASSPVTPPRSCSRAWDARTPGRWLREADCVLDLVVCFTASRTRQTWDLVSDVLDATTPVTHDARLHQASAGKLLGIVRNIPAHARTLILVGHNPGTQDLVLMLTGEADSYALEQTRTEFPASATAGQAAGARFAAGSIGRPVVRPFESGGTAPGLHRPDSAVGAGSVEGTADFSGSATRAKGADGLLIATPVPRRVCEITWLAAHLCVRRTRAMGRWVPFAASGLIPLRAFRGYVGLSAT